MNRKILVIDDDTVITKALGEYLMLKGFSVRVAENGQKGAEEFQKEPADLVILDLVMPVMAGVECLEHIRALDKKVPVIILTGFGTEDQTRRCQELGVHDIVRKGTSFEDFLDLIDDCLRKRDFQADPIQGEPGETRILIADDDTVIRTLLVEFLTDRGFSVTSAKDGNEAFDLILKQRPAIVFLDLLMPGRDGLSVLRELPSDILAKTRWIFITANRAKTREVENLKLSYCVLEKPFSLSAFDKTVKDLFQKFSISI